VPGAPDVLPTLGGHTFLRPAPRRFGASFGADMLGAFGPPSFAGMLSLALVLGPWLSLRTKLKSLVLALALNLQSLVLSLALRVESLVLALNFKSLVESFCTTG